MNERPLWSVIRSDGRVQGGKGSSHKLTDADMLRYREIFAQRVADHAAQIERLAARPLQEQPGKPEKCRRPQPQ